MNDIQYMIKPDWISWDEVQECQRKAHEVNNTRGFHMQVQDITGEELKEFIGDGVCLVALDGKNVVGTTSLVFRRIRTWWSIGKLTAYSCMTGILPEYQGTDVYIDLMRLRDEYFNKSDADIFYFSTADNNKVVQKIGKLKKFKYVQYTATGEGADYYSVIMAKWKDGCPYNDIVCNFMFKLSKVVVKTIWKPGYKNRFGF